MNMKCEVFYALCELSEFEINGVMAVYEDFGTKEDRNKEEAEPYCCADMHFTPILPTENILNKYKITKQEYYEICGILEDKLSFGRCGWCE